MIEKERAQMITQARVFRATVDAQAAENTAMRAELDAADAAYKEGVNSIYEPDIK